MSRLTPDPKNMPEKKLKLFEYINDEKIHRLTAERMLTYIKKNTDERTAAAIIKKISPKLVKLNNDTDYIGFTGFRAAADEYPPSKEKIVVICRDSSLPNERIKPIQKILLEIYKFCYLVSQGKLHDSQYVFANDKIKISKDHFVTKKFFDDHVGANDRAASEAKADAVAEKRLGKINVSTMLLGNDFRALNQEISKLQPIYVLALKTALTAAQNNKSILFGLYFLTLSEYSLIKNTEGRQERVRGRFYYSVMQRGGTFYMHHFQGDSKAADWEELVLPADTSRPKSASVPSIFYQK